MSDKLDQLRTKLRGMQVRISNEEKRLPYRTKQLP